MNADLTALASLAISPSAHLAYEVERARNQHHEAWCRGYHLVGYVNRLLLNVGWACDGRSAVPEAHYLAYLWRKARAALSDLQPGDMSPRELAEIEEDLDAAYGAVRFMTMDARWEGASIAEAAGHPPVDGATE